jgi:hypothetical protein
MSDEQWLKAMAKHEQDRVSGWSFVGGAVELAHVLHIRVVAEPVRFAKLAIHLTPAFNPEYSSTILRGLGDVATDDDGSEFVYEAVRHIAGLGHDTNDRWLGRALQHHQEHVPGDIVAILIDRALNSTDPLDNTPVFTRSDKKEPVASDLRANGMNTARGALAEDIGDLLIVDADGSLTDLVRPHLHSLAADPVLSVRSCTAHLLSAALRHARNEAVSALSVLADTDDLLLAADLMRRLMLYIGNVTPDVIDPYIDRMLRSEQHQVRQSGGWLGAYAALEWDRPNRMTQLIGADAAIRSGAARMCADLLARTSNIELAGETLTTLMDDEDESVRKEVAKIAPRLRDSALKPYEQLLEALIDSPSYVHAATQLLYTLEHAPDPVDGLALRTAQRFVEVLGVEAADTRTHAAADAHQVSQLVVRGLAQSREKAHRSGLLDVLDELLKLGVYGVDDAIAKTERL